MRIEPQTHEKIARQILSPEKEKQQGKLRDMIENVFSRDSKETVND